VRAAQGDAGVARDAVDRIVRIIAVYQLLVICPLPSGNQAFIVNLAVGLGQLCELREVRQIVYAKDKFV